MNSNTMKAMGIAALVGTAAMAVTGAMSNNSTKKKMKKATKKAVNTFSNVVDNMSNMMN